MGWERLAGVVVGVVLRTVVPHWPADPARSFPAVPVTCCAGTYLMGRPGVPNQQVLITAPTLYAAAVPGYPLARLEESLVGIAVVVLLGPLLWPPGGPAPPPPSTTGCAARTSPRSPTGPRALDTAHRAAHPVRHDAVLRAGLHLTHEALADHAPHGGTAAAGGTPPSV
ncbi:hypothetical protein AB0M92_27315 [Streptomyces sp. NPDC051582]|uniref:hypothetical protein n=1 Tax=Streptomyces sp. NPDC051582 TaxID=3155167 RepID=UPI003425AABF